MFCEPCTHTSIKIIFIQSAGLNQVLLTQPIIDASLNCNKRMELKTHAELDNKAHCVGKLPTGFEQTLTSLTPSLPKALDFHFQHVMH